MKKTNGFRLGEVLLIVLFACTVVSLSTALIVTKRFESDKNTISTKEITDENIVKFINAYNTLLDNYYEEVDKKALIDSVITSMTNYLSDPYTTYLNKEQSEELMSTLSGEYNGIGIMIRKEDTKIKIIEVFKNTPASNAGLLANDVITKVNGKDITSMETTDVVTEIKSNPEKVVVTVLRGAEEKTFEMKLSTVTTPTVTSEIYENGNNKTGYLGISTFANNTATLFEEKLKELEEQGITNLIIDVRSNTGGYLSVATKILELFMEKGKILYGVDEKGETFHYYDETEEHRTYKVVVLGNELSASASEILIAGMHDTYGATFVGKKTYGKGKIQKTSELNDGGLLKYTTSKWLTPKGVCIDGQGITPDEEAEYSQETDFQLEKGKELLGQ